MSGKRHRQPKNWRAASLVSALMADRGWYAIDLENASRHSGHPMRIASRRTVYRVIREGYTPSYPSQFEIAAVFGLLPSQVWGEAALPEHYAYLREQVAA